jgi:hypothetical protein
MTTVAGVLTLADPAGHGGFLATSVGYVGDGDGRDPVLDLAAPLDRGRWTGIVIHHLGEPAGDAESVHRMHRTWGYHGLGYHFLIGNGNGLGDGVIHVGYRWDEQLPGVQAVEVDSAAHNERSIGICLVGNGDRRPFTDRQIGQLVSLVRRLQQQLGIPAGRVHLHRELAPRSGSPGTFFPAAAFEEQLLDAPR